MPLADELGEPKFETATLVPTTALWVCPCCSYSQFAELEEDDAGECRVPDAERYVKCENCDADIDIGWSGWTRHDTKETARG